MGILTEFKSTNQPPRGSVRFLSQIGSLMMSTEKMNQVVYDEHRKQNKTGG